MRIISGLYKGFTIVDPNLETTRVSKERLREGLFSALHLSIKDHSALDLFAGSGSMGFEAFSRGASRVVLVDANFACITAMNKTKKNLRVHGDEIEIVYGSYPFVLTRYSEPFGFVFLDPPYEVYNMLDIIVDLLRHKAINANSTVIIEDTKHFSDDSLDIDETRTYKYGINHVTILKGIALK